MIELKKLFVSDLSLVCGKDSLRPSLQNVAFKNGFVYATNAHIIVRQSLSKLWELPQEAIDLLEGKFMHSRDIKNMLKCERFELTENSITGHTKKSGSFIAPLTKEDPNYKYPNIEYFIDNQSKHKKGFQDKICFDLDIINLLAKALYFESDNKHVKLLMNEDANTIIEIKTRGLDNDLQLAYFAIVLNF